VIAGLAWNLTDYLLGWGPVAGHAPPAFLAYFACGMLVALAVERSRAAGRELSGAHSVLLAGGAVVLLVANGVWHGVDRSTNEFAMEVFADLGAAVAFAAIIAAIVMGTGTGLRWLAWRPFVWVGTITYGLYLWHIPVIVWLRGAGLLPGGPLSAAVALPIAIALGAASWYLLEQPLMRRAGRIRRSAAATEARSGRSRWRNRGRTAPRPASWSARAVAERR
jgi:peptidoglycan/LPS O-acetylase OafA/YrhL